MPTIQLIYESEPDIPCEIEAFIQCAKCLNEKPAGVSPRQFARVQIGIRNDGKLQVWCNRHECNVVVIDFKLKENCGRTR